MRGGRGEVRTGSFGLEVEGQFSHDDNTGGADLVQESVNCFIYCSVALPRVLVGF